MPTAKRQTKTKHRKSKITTTSKNKRKYKKHTRARLINGGGFMDFVIHEEKNTSTKLPFGLSKYDRYLKLDIS